MNSKAGRDSVPRYLVFVFLLFAIGISGAGYLYYEAQKTNIKKDREANLSAIADLKVQQIVNWRRERIADGEVIFENSMIARRFQSFLESPSPASEIKQATIKWMESLREHNLYKQIYFLERKGTIRISTGAEGPHVGKQTLALANEAMKARKVIISDLQRDEKTGEIYIDLFVPLPMSQGRDTSYVGVLLFCIDPYQFLYPLIQTWPTTSQTSETLLIGREGDEVLFLNELRHAKNTALSLRLPLSEEQLPAALAVRGKEGIVEGIDYRGFPVLAALRGIPGSPWFLVAKVDLDEVYGPIRERAYLVVLLVLVLIALTGGIVVALLREQRLRYYQSQYKAELERRALLQHYEHLTKYANDIILLTDEVGNIIEANDRALAAYGYPREELIGNDLRTLRSALVEPPIEKRMGEIKEHNGMVYESVHRRKDGSTFPVEISSRMIEVEGKKYFQSIMRDITERKERDKDIRTLAQAVRSTSECVLISDLEDNFLFVNDAFTRIYGYDKKELIGKHVRIIRSEKNAPGIVEEILPATLRGGWQGELLNRKKDGTEFPILLSTSVVHDENGNPFALVGVALDITERKRAEEALRDSEWKLKEAQRLGRIGHWEFDVETGQIQWSDMVFELYERDPSLGPPIEEQEAEYYSVEDAARLRSCGQQTIETGKPYQIDVRLKVPGGSVKEVVATGTAVKDSHGRVIRLLGTVQDITERKRVEAQLERNLRETRLRFQVSQALAGAETEDEVLDVLIQNAGLYPQAFVVIFTFDRRGGELTAIGRRQDTFESGLTSVMPNGAGLPASRYTLFSRLSAAQPFVSEDVFTDERIEPAGREILRQTGAASFAMFPLTVGNERMALILAMAKHTGYFDEEKQHLYQTLAEQGTVALRAARLRGAIRESQQRFQALVETISDWIWEVDQKGIFTYVSPRISDLLGYEPVELLGKTPFDFMSPEETGRVRGVFDQLSGNRQPVINVENTLLHKDGRLVVFETSAVPFFDPGGEFKGYRGINRGITERKRAEEAIRYERNLLRTLIDNLPDGIYVKDSECRKTIANPADVRNVGRQSEAEVLGKDDFDFFPKELAEGFFADDQSVLQTGQPVPNREEYVLDAEGQKRWLLTSKLPLRNDKGQIIGLVGIGRDITMRKQVEEALQESEEKYRNLVERAHDGITIIQDAIIKYANPRLAEMWGGSVQEIVGTPFTDYVYPEELPQVVGRYKRRVAGEDIPAIYETLLKHRDGSKLYAELNAGVITFEGRPADLVIIRDITERKHAEEALRYERNLLRTLIDNLPDGIYVKDNECRKTIANVADVHNMGLQSEAEALGKGDFDLFPKDLAERFFADDQSVLQTGRPVLDREEYVLEADGQKRWLLTSKLPLRNDKGQIIGLVGIGRDITMRKQVEEALRYSETQLSNAMKIAQLGPWEYDVASDLFTFNDHFYAIFRTTAEEVGGYTMSSTCYAQRFVHPDDVAIVAAEIRKALETTDPHFSRQLEHRIIYTDGEIGYITVRFFVVKDDLGRTVKTYGVNQDITERKRAEEALRHEKALMDALMDNIPDSIYFKDRQCRLLRLNCKMMQSLKLDELSQAIGKTDVDLFGEEFGRKTLADEQRLMASGEPIVALIESRHLGDGQINWTSSTKVPLRDDRGEIVGLVGITREINELMRVQEVLSQERNLLRALVDNLPDQVFVKDRESQFLVCNAGVARRARAGSPTELLEKTDFDIFPQELAAEYFAEEQRIMESGDPIVEQENVFIEEGGAKTWFSATKIPLRDSQGNIIGLVGVNRDITERKHAEERLRLSDQILQRVNAVVLVADAKGEITYVSPSVKRILGYDPAESLGDGWWNVSQDDEDGRKREKDFVARCARGENPLSTIPYERIVKSRDGVPHYILWQDTQGPENTVIGVGHDISERKLLEEQLRQAQKLESLGTLAGGIAHDFNNVLGIILGYTSMLEETKADSKKSSRSIAAINKAVQRGAALVRQLLTFARKTDTLFESVRLNDVILELAGMLEQTFPRTIQVSSHLDKEIPSITGDGNQLHQALLNLSVNARDAMPSGGTLTFATRALMGAEVRRRFPEAQREKYVCISVADTGIGMDKPLLARAFEPFFTTKEEGHGTGLGLAVVYGIVASHHGFIDVESQVGHGTTFRLYFPIPERSIQMPLIATEQPQGQAAGGTETLLVVEDEEMMIELLKSILTGKGYQVMTAKDGAEAIEVYTQHKDQIGLVLMDMGLPKLSGAEVLQKLQGVNPKVKVILASGYISPHMKSEVLKAGVKHFVQKPYIPQEILRHIRKVLESDKQL